MTGIVKVQPGAIVSLDLPSEGAYMVQEFASPQAVHIKNLATGEKQTVSISRIMPTAPSNTPRPDLATVNEKVFTEAEAKYKIVKLLLDKKRCTQAELKAAAEYAKVTVSTIYRWIKDFREGMVLSSLFRKERSDNGKGRLNPDVEKIISGAIASYWLTPENRNYAKLHREVERLCRSANLRSPSLPTVINRANRIEEREAVKRRKGRPAADQFKLIEGTVPNADRPYGLIQIDHTLVDIELVDTEHRIAIGRPWITLAIDVYSRMVAGYYVSFDPPGALGTGICISNMILSKQAMMSSLGVKYEYPCLGRPSIIHLDNAREFHGNSLEHACLEYGIDIQFRKIATPRYGGHIERLMGTFAEEIKALSGTTFSNYLQKGDYDSAKNAVFTLKQFEVWLAHMFLGVYHQRGHKSLNEQPPLRRYSAAYEGIGDGLHLGVIEYVPDEQRLRLDFLPMFEGTVQPYGVKIDHITYSADVLRRWVGAKDPKSANKKRKFVFRRDPRDISYIYFYDPDAKTYFKIPYRNLANPPVSLWEMRAVRKWLVDQGKAAVDEVTLFRAYDAMRAIEEEQKHETMRVRRSDAAKRALRRKESPQPTPLVKDFTAASAPLEPEIPPANGLVRSDAFDEIERY